MHQAVLDRFVAFSTPLEGVVRSMYLDVKGLVTVGIGCLIDPVQSALPLPWVLPDGSAPTRDQIAAEWRALKAQQSLSKLHWKYAEKVTTIRLTDEGVLDVARGRLLANEKILRQYFPAWDSFPADAQLACCSMAWAVGAGFAQTFGNFRAAANAQNWISAMAACGIRTDGNAGLVPRNAANKLCLANAAAVIAQGLPLDELHWPAATPDAPQRDQEIRAEAEQALLEHQGHNDALWNQLTTDLAAGLDLNAEKDWQP
jgi:GH24 family phage-related lysozyme (muramidase)